MKRSLLYSISVVGILLIFALIFGLYGYNLKGLLYPALLSVLFIGGVGISEHFIQKKKEKILKDVLDYNSRDIRNVLPEADENVEKQVLSNSLKYTETGEIKIAYDESERSLSIIDSGIGIDSENLPRIFERGYTGYNGRTGTHSSGIGLYISKEIANRLSIEIRYESKVNEGTEMHLIFPKNQRVVD